MHGLPFSYVVADLEGYCPAETPKDTGL